MYNPHTSNHEQHAEQGSALFEKVSTRLAIIRPALECVINAVNVQDPRIQYNETIEAKAAMLGVQQEQEQLLGAMDYSKIENVPALQPLRSAVADANAKRLIESARLAVDEHAIDSDRFFGAHGREDNQNILAPEPQPTYPGYLDDNDIRGLADVPS